jgi:hypothetical protein
MQGVQPDSIIHEHLKMAIVVKCVEDLQGALKSMEESMNRNAASNDKLGSKVFWLNYIIAVATVFYTIVAVYEAIHLHGH